MTEDQAFEKWIERIGMSVSMASQMELLRQAFTHGFRLGKIEERRLSSEGLKSANEKLNRIHDIVTEGKY